MRLDDLRLFAKVAEKRSFTAAARELGMPKQTLSRRVAELEAELGTELCRRTTRRLHLTDVGAAYAARCVEIVKLADEATRAVTDASARPSGTLRVTADPVFGEAFVSGLVIDYARRFPDVRVEVVLTRRYVDLVEEGFDVAFRIGRADDTRLTATQLGPARVRYCASPSYVSARGAPSRPEELASHDTIVVASDGAAVRWPFRGKKDEPALVSVSGRLRTTSFEMARDAALAGLGIGIFPEFACIDDLRRGRLVGVLDEWTVDVGSVWIVHPTGRYLTARVRELIRMALGQNRPVRRR